MSRLRGRALLALVLVLGLCLLVRPSGASAHASVVRSDPTADSVVQTPPPRVTIWFSEPISLQLSGIQVYDSAQKRVDHTDSTGDPNDNTRLSVGINESLPNGTYTVAWHNVSSLDGHALRESFVFYVGVRPEGAVSRPAAAPPTLPSPADPWVRWVVLLSALAIAGGLLFEPAVLRPAVSGGSTREPIPTASAAVEATLRRLRWWAFLAFFVASVVHLGVQAAIAGNTAPWRISPTDVTNVIRATNWGILWLLRVALVLVAAGAVIGLRTLVTARPRASRNIERFGWMLPFALLVGALATFSESSHASSMRGLAAPGFLNDCVHIVAAAIWVGGLYALLPTLVVFGRRLDAEERRPLFGRIAARFTILGSLGLGTLVLTGLFASWLEVTTWPALKTPYGLTLIAKIAVVAAMAAAGGANLLWARRELARPERSETATRSLRRLVTVEVICGVLVVLAAGFLTSLEPARQVEARAGGGGIVFDQTDGGTRIKTRITPGSAGNNRGHVDLYERNGHAVNNASSVTLTLKYLDVDLGETTVTALPGQGGGYDAPNVILSLAGAWQVQVQVTRPDAADATAATRFLIGSTASALPGGPNVETGRALFSWLVVAVGMLVLVVAPGAWRTRVGRTRMRIVATAIVLCGVVLVYGLHNHGGPSALANVNPVTADAQSIDAGRMVYQQQCGQCHGAQGLGDGLLAKDLNPPPFNLVVHAPLHGDGQLFQFIAGGVPGTAMPAWAGKLSDTQIWNLVNYLRTLKATVPTQ